VFFWAGHTDNLAPLEVTNQGGGYAIFVSSTDQGFWTVLDYGIGAFVGNPQELSLGWNPSRENPLTGKRIYANMVVSGGLVASRTARAERHAGSAFIRAYLIPMLRGKTYWIPPAGSGVPIVNVEPTDDGDKVGAVRVSRVVE